MVGRLTRLGAVLGLACLAASGCVLATPALATQDARAGAHAHKHGRLPIIPRHGKPFVPVLGDWEAVSNGVPASFELVYKPAFKVFGSPYGYEDLITFGPDFSPTPTECRLSAAGSGGSVISENSVAPLGKGGTFPFLTRSTAKGVVRTPAEATLAERLDLPTTPGFAPCPYTSWSWTFHPAKRALVRDGTWTVKLQNGETQSVEVKAGGRAIEGLSFPAFPAECPAPIGGADMFIAANGVASYSDQPEQTGITLTFKSPEAASGQFSLPPSSCHPQTIAMTASLTKPG